MTVIVVDARRGIIAADTLVSREPGEVAGYTTKIVKTRKGELAGARGDAAFCAEFLEWSMKHRCKRCLLEFPDGSAGMILTRKREILTYEDELPEKMAGLPWWAIGSGAPYAIATMDLGYAVEDAVRQAMKWSLTCGGEMMTLTLD